MSERDPVLHPDQPGWPSTAPVAPHDPTAQHWPEGFAPPPPFPAPTSRKWYWIKRGIAATFLLLAILFVWLAFTAPLSKSLQPIAPPRVTLLSADGQPIARNGAVIDRPVKAAELPAHVKQAFLAIEDRRFYSHWGIDPRGLARAAWNNMGSGGTQGGSTITQQLAKFTFLTPERTMTRKAREMLIAFWLEIWLTKDEILERYLSNAYFGENLYGLRAASLHYFYRQPEKLTLSQAAMLAGVVQAPSRLAPTKNPKLAAKRAKLVLAAMADAEFISKAKANAAPVATTDVRARTDLPTGTYFADWAMPGARALARETYGDIKVKTTLDARLQRAARDAIGRASLGAAQVALVAMRPNGEVVAMIGGRSYKASSFNRATQAKRQPGSTFKLFVYLAALRSGMTPDSIVDDSPITQGTYRPKNYGDKYRGKISLKQAFALSSNVVAVRLYRQLGDRAVIKAARDLGIKSPITADPSMALGSSGVTLLELTSAYAAVAANQYPLRAHAFVQQEPGFFEGIWKSPRSFGSAEHDRLTELLRTTITQGTGKAAALAIPAFGKTGTSQDSRDALFVGYAGDLVVGVWIGKDDNTPLKGITGGGLPARIWRDFMGRAVKGARPVTPAPKPVEKAPDPEGDIIPLDLPEIPIKIDENTNVTIGDGQGVRVSTEIGGVPLDVTLDKDGFDIKERAR
jgi:penicillin-binding protein 1A